MQEHIIKMYDNISALKFQEGANNEMVVCGMKSAEGEEMDFKKLIPAEGRVEDWMTSTLNEMRRSNRLITKDSLYHYCHEM